MGFSLLAISIERVIAIFDKNYEHRCRKSFSKTVLPFGLFAPSTILTLSYLLGNTSADVMYIIPFAYVASGIDRVSGFLISKNRIKNRHIRELRLTQKFASVESIRAMSIFIPSVMNDVICFLILIGLTIYSANFTPYQLGEDPTKLSHAYDLLAAYKSAFIPCFLFYKYRAIRRKNEHENSVDEKRRVFEQHTRMMLMYDWISCSLWLLEFSIWFIGCLCSFPAVYFLITDSILHFNFRIIFIALFVRNFLGTADRTAVIVSRAFFYGESRLPYQALISASMLFHMCQVGVTYTFISCERLFSISDPNYENRCKSPLAKIILVIAIFAPATILILFYAINGSNLSGGFESYLVYASYGIAGIVGKYYIQSSQIAYRISKRKLKRRHVLRLQLNEKFASTENIRAMHLFIPCVTNEIICFVILLAAYKSSFTPCFVAFKYLVMRKEGRKSEKQPTRSIPNHIDSHFKELQSYWK
ncbi:hypothetical protein PENTCL1PPCAC_22488 [Pristionchus entomophagus]|uniref:G protein-coupled receptor n=1 Tax=Pristionchus entomophagus TaxID=358040 RepID=A0AAV5U1J1_9BILA|nr:hypothetical protein PENTCL1PPCAC_22488 [Pristionchus entomophagus]